MHTLPTHIQKDSQLFHENHSRLNHLGVEVRSTDDVVAAAERFASAGLSHRMTESDRCCHAVQDKVWVNAPDVPLGAWEVYTVLADDPSNGAGTQSTCCSTAPDDGNGPGCTGSITETPA